MTARQLYDHITEVFKKSGFSDSRYEAASLLSACIGLTRDRLITHPETVVDDTDCQSVVSASEKRCARMPLAYLAGQAVFFGLDFTVRPGVLIPRADSEVLVESALDRLAESRADLSVSAEQSLRLLDLCTGSGCIGISVAHAWRQRSGQCILDLVDIDAAACDCAAENIGRHQMQKNSRVFQSDLFPPPGTGQYDLITANPPYIATEQIQTLMPEVRLYEPGLALDGGPDGLLFYRRLISNAPDYLRSGGWLLFEHGCDQPEQVAQLFEAEAHWQNLFCRHDYAGHPRVTGAQLRKQA